MPVFLLGDDGDDTGVGGHGAHAAYRADRCERERCVAAGRPVEIYPAGWREITD